MNNVSYNYDLFPKMDKGYLLIPEPCAELKPFQEIYDRFCSAIYMASRASGKTIGVGGNRFRHCAYIRASLAEFSSIEECVVQLSAIASDKKSFLIRNSSNPAFHFLKLLRNYNIHLSESTLAEKTIQITFGDDLSEYDLDVLYIDNLHIKEILKLNSAKYYIKTEIEKFIDFFEESQHKFGVSSLLLAIIVQYSEYISGYLEEL